MIIEKVDKNQLQNVMDDIYAKDDEEKGIDGGEFKTFAYALKDDEGNILGGIHGYKIFAEIYVDEICLSKEVRGKGFGKKLLEIVEKDLNDGNCDNINLVTNEFQNAIDFYKKCGFEVEFIRKNNKNSGFNKYFMIKKL